MELTVSRGRKPTLPGDPREQRAAVIQPREIVALVGFMGAGKTSVGAALAGRLGVPFVDLDHA
ncbi:MAG: shikimate kinase, partial [Clostridia bacterium]|nr:shikimate kinase [Deltaproteobacteria bacterium]